MDSNIQSILKQTVALAKRRDAKALYNLALMYHKGQYVEKSPEKAFKYYREAAQLEHDKAQNNLANLYEHGIGVEQDIKQAIQWYSKAAENGNLYSIYNMARKYEVGHGVEQDLQRAKSFYLLAMEHGHRRATERFFKLNQRLLNEKKAVTKLFGSHLLYLDRNYFRELLQANGLVTLRGEQQQTVFDYYDSCEILSGSDRLAVAYLDKKEFAFAEYRFPSWMNEVKIDYVLRMLNSKYGESNNKKLSQHDKSWHWTLDDGVEIVVKTSWPDTTVTLQYRHPEHYPLFKRQLVDSLYAQDKQLFESQEFAY